jgi:hypothetical protein
LSLHPLYCLFSLASLLYSQLSWHILFLSHHPVYCLVLTDLATLNCHGVLFSFFESSPSILFSFYRPR